MAGLIRVQPVVDGLLNATGLASRLRTMALQQAEFDERKNARVRDDDRADQHLQLSRDQLADSRSERTYQRGRQNTADLTSKFQTDLALATNPAIQELAPGQTTRNIPMQFGAGADTPLNRLTNSMNPTSIDAPVGQTLDYGSRRFAVKSQPEMFGEQISRAKTMLSLEMEKLKGTEAIKNPEVYVPGYGNVPKTAMSAAIGAVRGGEDRRSREKVASNRDATTLTAAGIKASAKAKGLTEQQKVADIRELEKEEREIDARMVSSGQALASGKGVTAKGVEFDLTDEQKKQMTNKRKFDQRSLDNIRNRKIERGYTDQADAGATHVANTGHLKAYAKQKGIGLEQAKKEFAKFGFRIED